MKLDEAKRILKEIYVIYPNFNKNRMADFDKIWLQRLVEGDFEKTFKKMKEYSAESPYPPTLADVFVKEHVYRDDHMAESIREAEENVRKEKADPEKAKERERLLKEMDDKLKRLNAYD